MSLLTKGNNMGNLRASDFDMEAFNEVVKNLRNAHKAAVDFGKDRPETQERVDQVKADLQEALTSCDVESMQKLSAELKRLMAKLAELPTEKIVAFDTAVNAYAAFNARMSIDDSDKSKNEVAPTTLTAVKAA